MNLHLDETLGAQYKSKSQKIRVRIGVEKICFALAAGIHISVD